MVGPSESFFVFLPRKPLKCTSRETVGPDCFGNNTVAVQVRIGLISLATYNEVYKCIIYLC